eukprot:XP_001707339.1 Hypothetical protein GL50803_34406 [Giardia lamblia ATCC 50803]
MHLLPRQIHNILHGAHCWSILPAGLTYTVEPRLSGFVLTLPIVGTLCLAELLELW